MKFVYTAKLSLYVVEAISYGKLIEYYASFWDV